MLCADPANRTELSLISHFKLLITVSSIFEWPQWAVISLVIVLDVEDTCDVERSISVLQACGCRVGSQVHVIMIPVYFGLWVHTIEATLHLFVSSHLVGEFSSALSCVNTVTNTRYKSERCDAQDLCADLYNYLNIYEICSSHKQWLK